MRLAKFILTVGTMFGVVWSLTIPTRSPDQVAVPVTQRSDKNIDITSTLPSVLKLSSDKLKPKVGDIININISFETSETSGTYHFAVNCSHAVKIQDSLDTSFHMKANKGLMVSKNIRVRTVHCGVPSITVFVTDESGVKQISETIFLSYDCPEIVTKDTLIDGQHNRKIKIRK